MSRSLESAGIGPRIPTWLLTVAVVVVGVNVVLMVAGAIQSGVTLDEPSHVHRLQGFLSTGWYVSEEHVTNDRVTQEGGYVYAPVVALVGHAVNVLAGTETWGTVSESADAYAVRHVVIAGFGALGLLAVAATARLLLRSWRWGVVTAAVLTAVPVYMGYATYNVKDLPVAAGYAVATLGCVALTHPAIRSRRMSLLAGGALALGIWIAGGVHPAMLVSIGMSVLIALAVSWLRLRRGDTVARERMKTRLLVAVGGSLAGYVALVCVYPKLFLRPNLLVQSVLKSGDFPWNGSTLTAGTFMPADHTPSSYLPLWFAAQTPVVTSLLCLGVIVWFFRGALQPAARRAGDGDMYAGVAVVLVQALFLPWVAIAGGSTLYQGARQMLFVVPGIALLAGVGGWLLARRLSAPPALRAANGLWGLVAAMLLVTSASSAALFPYSYTWFNAATALRPVEGNWTLDFEWQSSREVLSLIDSIEPGRCTLVQRHNRCDRDQVSPYVNSVGEHAIGPPLAPDEIWRLAYGGPVSRPDAPMSNPPLGHDCKRVGGVTRHLFWQRVTMTSVERCEA